MLRSFSSQHIWPIALALKTLFAAFKPTHLAQRTSPEDSHCGIVLHNGLNSSRSVNICVADLYRFLCRRLRQEPEGPAPPELQQPGPLHNAVCPLPGAQRRRPAAVLLPAHQAPDRDVQLEDHPPQPLVVASKSAATLYPLGMILRSDLPVQDLL